MTARTPASSAPRRSWLATTGLSVWLGAALASAALAQSAPDPAPGRGPQPSAAASAAAADAFAAGVKAFDEGRHREAFMLWLPLAERGKAEAQFNVAVMYEGGLGVVNSHIEAARWYRAAAERGDVAAQLKMGSLHEAGVGVARDLGSASDWYGAAAQGSAKDPEAARQARVRLAALSGDHKVQPEDVTAFDGGRFVLLGATNKACVVALQGVVTPSANFVFDVVLKKAKARECARPLTLLLESPGGHHEAGLALGRSVRNEGMRTVARYACASSCATIFLGGTERVLWGARAAIGFHQAAMADLDKPEEGRCVTTAHDPTMVALRRYVRFVVPETSDDIMRMVMSTPCKSIEWVNGQRALDLRVATRLEAEGEDVFGPYEARVDAVPPAR